MPGAMAGPTSRGLQLGIMLLSLAVCAAGRVSRGGCWWKSAVLYCAIGSLFPFVDALRPSGRALGDASARASEPYRGAASWWATIGNRTFFQPRAGGRAGPDQNISNYYYVRGSFSALTVEMRKRRVHGSREWHIFYLPDGPSTLRTVPRGGDRRSSFSELRTLQHGAVLGERFPAYQRSSSYAHPLSKRAQAAETSAAAQLDAGSVSAYLQALTSLPSAGKFGVATPTRSWSNFVASSAAQKFLKSEFAGIGLQTCLQSFSYQGTTQANVVAHIPGRTTDSVIVGAHYDSRPYAGAAPGAVDNGSGVALMLAVAKAFKNAQVSPVKTILFVGFAAEEVGLKGSDAFAGELASGGVHGLLGACGLSRSLLQTEMPQKGGQAKPAHSAIILDEVGWRSHNLAMPTVNMEAYDWTGQVMEHLAQASKSLNGDALNVVHSNNPFGSDHMSFLDRGIPAVLAIHGDDMGYPYYHTSDDTFPNVSPAFSVQIGRMILGAVMRLAGAE